MVYITRLDNTMIRDIRTLLDESKGVAGTKTKRIEAVKKIFAIITTPVGKYFTNKHDGFKTVVKDKIIEFNTHLPELAPEWYRQLFDEEMPRPEPEPEPNDMFSTWIDCMTVSAPLTRMRLVFLACVWDIIDDIDRSSNTVTISHYRSELYDTLVTDYGQNMLRNFPILTDMLENELYHQYTHGSPVWGVWWSDIFGCDINDPHYSD